MTKAQKGISFGTFLILCTFFVAFLVHKELNKFYLTALIGLAGIACGWFLGFLASPYTEEKPLNLMRLLQ